MKSAWRDRRKVRAFVLAVLAAISACPIAVGAADPTHPLTPSQHVDDANTFFSSGIPARGELAPRTNRARLLADGAVLYGVHCSTCHGANLAGMPGAPSLLEAGGAAVDFYMTTGRMPLALRAANDGSDSSPLGAASASGVQAYHVPALFDASQTAAVDAYVDARARRTTPIPIVRLDPAKLQRGRLLFEENCQACHGAAAQGATAGGQWVALPLKLANPRQIGEAIRVGPGVMPRFTPNQLPDGDLDAIATYVRYLATERQTYGGAVMEYLGPISEGAVSAIVGVGFLFWVIYFTGTKADGRRLNELD
jgi:ubiquinol-cytochrome c reductase cytochrome c subunit